MGFQPRQPGFNQPQVAGETQTPYGYIRRQKWTNPVAVDADRILNDAADNTDHTTFLAQPDFARKLTLVASDTGTEEVVITGTNIRNEAISETIALNGTNTVETTKAFKTVSSINIPTLASNATVDVGVSDALGLDRCMEGNEVLAVTMDGVYETTRPTVTFDADEVEKNTINPNTALNASLDVVAVFVSVEKTGKRHTTA